MRWSVISVMSLHDQFYWQHCLGHVNEFLQTKRPIVASEAKWPRSNPSCPSRLVIMGPVEARAEVSHYIEYQAKGSDRTGAATRLYFYSSSRKWYVVAGGGRLMGNSKFECWDFLSPSFWVMIDGEFEFESWDFLSPSSIWMILVHERWK